MGFTPVGEVLSREVYSSELKSPPRGSLSEVPRSQILVFDLLPQPLEISTTVVTLSV